VPLGEGTYRAVQNTNDAPFVERLCYKTIWHRNEDIQVKVADRVKVSSSEGLENIAHIRNFFHDDEEGILKASCYWYYTAEQINAKRLKRPFGEKELLASNHIDTFPVDAIEYLVRVLTFSHFCRYHRLLKALEHPLYRVLVQNCETEHDDDVYFSSTEYDWRTGRVIAGTKPLRLPIAKCRKNSISGATKEMSLCSML
jgi:hypothetical protein